MLFLNVFSNSTKYGIRAIVYMMKNKSSERNTVVEMASELHIPQPFLSKVLQQLAKSNIISSSKGRGGGFYLTKENMQRPLIDVVVCIEGHNVFNKCILGLPECSDDNPCILHSYFREFKLSLEKSVCKESVDNLIKMGL